MWYTLHALFAGALLFLQSLFGFSTSVSPAAVILASSSTQPCVTLAHTLIRGIHDANVSGEVSILQTFLATDPSIYPLGLVTGYFGYATKAAVSAFQIKYGLGTTSTPGLGGVGPKTRAEIQLLTCAGIGTNTLTASTTVAVATSTPNVLGPTLFSVVSTSVTPTQGDPLTLNGTNFATSTSNTIHFGSLTSPGWAASADGTTISTHLPFVIDPGTYEVSVETKGGVSNSVTITIAPPQVTSPGVNAVPTLSQIIPTTLMPGNKFVLVGTNFSTSSSNTLVVGNLAVPLPSATQDGTQIYGVVPNTIPPGTYNISLKTVAGNSTTIPLMVLSSAFNHSFIWVGGTAHAFTDADIQFIATHYKVVVIQQWHANQDVATQQADARRLKAANPTLEIFPYFPSVFRYNNASYGTDTFQDSWLFHDQNGQLITHYTATPSIIAHLVDISNPGYRTWALGIISSWMAAAPYSGIALDDVDPIPANPALRLGFFLNHSLSTDQVSAWNTGLTTFVADAQKLVGNSKFVIFNGIENTPRYQNRDLGLFASANSALNEDFCISNLVPSEGTHFFNTEYMKADLDVMTTEGWAGKTILEKTNYLTSTNFALLGVSKEQAERYCYGAFLMGYVPGFDFYKFGADYIETTEIHDVTPEADLFLGRPTGPYKEMGGLFSRTFEHGMVYVNSADTTQLAQVSGTFTLFNRGVAGMQVQSGNSISVPSHEALFLLQSAP